MPSMSSLVATRRHYRLTSVVVNDETHSRENLALLLHTHCPEVQVTAEIPSVETAPEVIESAQPDVVFLDVRIPQDNDFDLLNSIKARDLLIVFVTAHDSRGRQAVRANAVDYPLKPADIEKLREAVDRLLTLHHKRRPAPAVFNAYHDMLTELISSLAGSSPFPQRIVLPTSEGLIVEELANIIRLESDNYYTTIVRHCAPNIFLAKTLKDFELALEEPQFVRVHNSHIINMAYMQKFDKRDGGYVLMADGAKIPVSRRRHGLLLEKLKIYRRV